MIRRRLPALRTLPSSTVRTRNCSPILVMSSCLPLKANEEVRDTTRRASTLLNALMISSAMPSVKYSLSGSALMLANGSTATDGVSSFWPWPTVCLTRRSSATSSPAVWKRASRSFSRHRAMKRSRSDETLRLRFRTGSGVSRRIALRMSASLSPVNGASPVTISYSSTPKEKMSDRASTCSPRTCSGDM